MTAAAVLVAAPAAAQTPRDTTEPGASAPAGRASGSGWTVYPNERHILVRAGATTGVRLSDPFAQGLRAPIAAYVQGTYAFVRLGSFLLGPSLGVQVGFDNTGAQYAAQPGVTLYRRVSGLFGFTAHLGVPVLITRGACEVTRLPAQRFVGGGVLGNRNTIPVPGTGYCPTLSLGVEASASAAIYIRSGVAITAEAAFDLYFGDAGLIYPIVGGGLGIMVDYEVLP